MSKDNKTEQMLLVNLDNDLSWRIKELNIIKNKIPSQENEEQHALIRAGITLLYAHWEGFVKNAAENYLNFVSLKKLKHNELQSCFLALCFKKQINDLQTNKFELQQNLVDFMLNELDKRAYVPYEGIIQTKSNLKFWVFRDICIIIGVDYKKYQLKEKAIDTMLVERRNKIAHGKHLQVDYDGYMDIYDIVVQMMRDIKSDILDAAFNEKYRKN
ncbi:MAE_28990/MAE_18760 family HEPN-like nuclease [Anabaena azotica]|uniref:MAE_28990/MAE_18760 family HEPN-like nuclease n=1 Tax=Anabaena azotica TaxID=197653 RepID=UPI0039A5D235